MSSEDYIIEYKVVSRYIYKLSAFVELFEIGFLLVDCGLERIQRKIFIFIILTTSHLLFHVWTTFKTSHIF